MSDHFISHSDRAIPVNVSGERVVEALVWILDHGTFARGERVSVRNTMKSWLEPGVIDMYYGRRVPFYVGSMTFLSDDIRMLFKLTFSS